jgi:hypothetical protein
MVMENLQGSAGSLLMLVGKILAIVVFAVIVFFASRMIQREIKKRKSFKISAHITNPDGSHMLWKCGKFKDKDKLEKMLFMRRVKMLFGMKAWAPIKGESMPVINPSHIVSNTVHLFRYGISQYAVIPPTVYRNPELLEKEGIKLINMNALHWKGLEQRAAISRWAAMKDKMAKLTPWITLFLIVVVAGVAIFFISKMALSMYTDAVAARTIECSSLVGGGSAPLV